MKGHKSWWMERYGRKCPYYPPGVFIKGAAQYDYFWKYGPLAGFENVANFDFEALSDDAGWTPPGSECDDDCYCEAIAQEFGFRGVRFWQRIVGKLRSQAMAARASALVRSVCDVEAEVR